MRYIYTNEDGFTTFDRYFDYIESVRSEFSTELYEFAIDENNYNLSSHESLHDSWLNQLLLEEKSDVDESKKRTLDIKLSLLGPYQDLVTLIHYVNVQSYAINMSNRKSDYGSRHGDLLLHELTITNSGSYEHEMEFDGSTNVSIVCAEISITRTKLD